MQFLMYILRQDSRLAIREIPYGAAYLPIDDPRTNEDDYTKYYDDDDDDFQTT